MTRALLLITITLAACGGATEYERVTTSYTRKAGMRERYQEALSVAVTYKSLEWREAFAKKQAKDRGLDGAALDQYLAKARADDQGPLEFQMIVTTWDRRENDLDRGKKSVWRVVLLDDQGIEVEPLEIVRDKRPDHIIDAEFREMKNFAKAYVARFPRDKLPEGSKLRMHMSSPRGGVRLVWEGVVLKASAPSGPPEPPPADVPAPTKTPAPTKPAEPAKPTSAATTAP